jgi:hypothetical protein
MTTDREEQSRPPASGAAPPKPWWSLSAGSQRALFRWVHILFAIPILGYIYSPFDQIPNYAGPTRFFFVPVLALSGLWMWKGHLLLKGGNR